MRKKKKQEIQDNNCNEEIKKQVQIPVTVKVQWPSKDAKRRLPDDLESLGKMLVRGTYKQIANAALKSEKLKNELVILFQKEVEKEMTQLCLRKNPSCLRNTQKTSMMTLTMEKVADKIKQRAPIFHSILSVACINRKSKGTQPKNDFAGLGIVAGICLRNR